MRGVRVGRSVAVAKVPQPAHQRGCPCAGEGDNIIYACGVARGDGKVGIYLRPLIEIGLYDAVAGPHREEGVVVCPCSVSPSSTGQQQGVTKAYGVLERLEVCGVYGEHHLIDRVTVDNIICYEGKGDGPCLPRCGDVYGHLDGRINEEPGPARPQAGYLVIGGRHQCAVGKVIRLILAVVFVAAGKGISPFDHFKDHRRSIVITWCDAICYHVQGDKAQLCGPRCICGADNIDIVKGPQTAIP